MVDLFDPLIPHLLFGIFAVASGEFVGFSYWNSSVLNATGGDFWLAHVRPFSGL